MKATFRPLRWTGPVTPADQRRTKWAFKASWQSTLNLLDDELTRLDATDFVIEADFTEADLRLDGMPRSNARPPIHPGVKVAFESKFGPLIYQTDSCEWWQHNVRSIALGLEALRAVDRYGVTKRGQQYDGWKAIGAGPTPMNGKTRMARDQALLTIAQLSADLPGHFDADRDLARYRKDPTEILRDYRHALRRTHPDHGGNATAFQRVQEARRVLNLGGVS